MNRPYFLHISMLVFLLAFPFIGFTQIDSRNVAGNWEGTLNVEGAELLLIADINKDASGSYTGVLHSPMQGASNIPITTLTFDGDSVMIVVSTLMATIKGQLLLGDSILDCSFQQGPFVLPLLMKKGKTPFAFDRPQEPLPPFPYTEQEVTFLNEVDGIRLAGTLTHPDKKTRYPAVVLISGSGAQDRNEEIMGHKPFLVIADWLTRQGIAVLRFDDRGVGSSEGDATTGTSEDFMRDVEAGVQFLKDHTNINPNQIGLIGHSEGGMIAPMVASRDSSIAFIIMLAGPGVKGEDIITSQIKKIRLISGQKKMIVKKIVKDASASMNILQQEADTAKAAATLRNYYIRQAEKLPEAYHSLFGYDKASREATIKAYNSPWFRYFIAFEPIVYLKDVDVPVLALYGGKDIQVLSKLNSKAIQKMVKKNKKGHFTIKTYPGRNHLFQKADSGAIHEYSIIKETIGEEVLMDITHFIKNIQQ